MPNKRQAIIWTNADPIHWHIYAALEGDLCPWHYNRIHSKSTLWGPMSLCCNIVTSWCRNAFCINGLLWERSTAHFWFFLHCYSEQAEQDCQQSGNWRSMTLMWHHCNDLQSIVFGSHGCWIIKMICMIINFCYDVSLYLHYMNALKCITTMMHSVIVKEWPMHDKMNKVYAVVICMKKLIILNFC